MCMTHLAAWLLVFPFGSAHTSSPVLDDYLRELSDGNPSLQAARRRWEAAQHQEAVVTALPDPNVSVGLFASEVETRVGPQQSRLGVKQMLPWKGKRGLRGVAARAEAARAETLYETLHLELVTEFQRQYADYYYLGRALKLTEEHLALLQDLEAVVTERYQANNARYETLIRVQIDIERLRDRLQTQQRALPPLRAGMNALLGRPVDGEMPLPERLPEQPTPEVARARATPDRQRAAHPALAAFDHGLEAARATAALAARERYPDFQLGLDWIQTGSAVMPTRGSGKDPVVLSVGVNLPIARKKYRAMARAAQLRTEAVQADRSDQAARLEASLQRALFAYDDAARKFVLYRDQIIPRAEEALRVMLTGFQTGEVTYSDLIDAEQTLLTLQLSLNQAEADRLKATAALEAALGTHPFSGMEKE